MTEHAQPAGLIPDHLLSNIKKGDCVLFLGADLPLGYEGAPLSRPELSVALTERRGVPSHLPWPEAAQAYLGKFTGDRHGLISFVAECCSGPDVRPGPIHEAIARIGFRVIVTAWYDDLLEQTLRHAGYRVNRVVQDIQLPYAQEGEHETIVVKLYGCLSDPESLVLDTWDHEELMDRLSRKLELVTAFCSLRPPLFVNFDLADRMPMRLYVRASTNMVEHMRRAYAVCPHSLNAVQAAWRGKNVEFHCADATAFLQALAAQMPIAGPTIQSAIRVHRPPYKFLDYYEPGDADIFCGRDTESQIVARLALSHRLLTLFGPSGAGKTSLLLAGVLPRLSPEGYKHVYVRALDDPLLALRKGIAILAGRTDWETGTDLRTFLSTMLATGDKLVVVLDQFEELFLRVGSRQRACFFQELAKVLENPERDVRVILGLREDYLAHLDEARSYLPDIFTNSYRLSTLDRSNARVAMTEPAARAGVTVEAILVDALVGGEGRQADEQRAGDLVEADGHVPPAVLQIVLDRLYREALPPDHPPDAPPPSNLALTLAAYRAIRHQLGEEDEAEELQGAEAILASYVNEGLARLPDLKREDGQTPLGADPAMGEAILKVMVTSQATKEALTQTKILELLDEAGVVQANDATDQKWVQNTRLGLEQVRLLRSFERDGIALYELAHDYLAAEVARRIGETEMGTKLARELLRREMDNWRGARLLIRPEVLRLIDEHRDALKRLGNEESELLFRSALAAQIEVRYWAERAKSKGVDVDAIALAGLKSGNFRVRVEAATQLGMLQDNTFIKSLAEMLADPYPQVRMAAIRSLEKLSTPTARQALLANLTYEVYVPAGEVEIGGERWDNEKPIHQVNVDAFYIGRYPVTNADYRRYMDDVGRPFGIPPGKANHPVVNVPWYDARDYTAWAGMRLLTEVEWEKAAGWGGIEEIESSRRETSDKGHWPRFIGRRWDKKGKTLPGKKFTYPWGDVFDKKKCNTLEAGVEDTTPVGHYSPQGDSPLGVADMAGNVWEWTSSLYRPYPYQVDDGREDPYSPDSRVVRGGSFDSPGWGTRCAYRNHDYPSLNSRNRGFRVGAVASPSLFSESDPSEI